MGSKTAFQKSVQNQILKEMDKLIVRGREKPIKPIRRHCSCGKRVLKHHKYCEKCWELHRQLIK